MMARRVRRHRPQSPPAPHASTICFDVVAPLVTASPTTWLVTPKHKHTNIRAPSTLFFDAHEMRVPANELGGVGVQTGIRHPLRAVLGRPIHCRARTGQSSRRPRRRISVYVVHCGDVEPFKDCRRPHYLTNRPQLRIPTVIKTRPWFRDRRVEHDLACTNGRRFWAVILQRFPHPLDIVDTGIASENE